MSTTTRHSIPQTQRPVAGHRGKHFTVWRKCHAIHGAFMAFKDTSNATGCYVPDSDGPVFAAGCESLTSWSKYNPVCLPYVPAENTQYASQNAIDKTNLT